VPGPDPATRVRVRVPAKINLHLGVGALRPDGYHELHNLFHAVDLTDEIVATPGRDGISISVTGTGAADVPTDDRNLAWRAAAALAEHAGRPVDVHLEIIKRIPVAGGMAGGSADAAGALLACATLWQLPRAELVEVAAGIGSDTGFPLVGGTALGTGRGELLTPVSCPARLHWVLALADFGISAGDAYRTIDALRAAGSAPPPAGPPDELIAALAAGDVDRIAAGLRNELEPAACELAPELRDTLAAGAAHGALAGLVSGSGPTCAFLCRDADAATALARVLSEDGGAALVATGQVPGARVVS
jgi:4-diphosphocytidyl-2-C-methyl-D-erythritol kinase